MYAGRMEVEALVALRHLCEPLKQAKLIDLNLSDNALGAPGVESCRAVLSGKLLRAVKVCNCGLSAEVTKNLSQCFFSFIGFYFPTCMCM